MPDEAHKAHALRHIDRARSKLQLGRLTPPARAVRLQAAKGYLWMMIALLVEKMAQICTRLMCRFRVTPWR